MRSSEGRGTGYGLRVSYKNFNKMYASNIFRATLDVFSVNLSTTYILYAF